MSEQKAFEWGSLGESWWRENGAACRATETQIKYACSRHQGANKSRSATLAGYSGSPEALRSTGVRAEGSKGVEDLLVLAAASEGGDIDGPATDAEIDRKLTKLIRSPDGAISLKAIEARDKRLAVAQRAAARSQEEDADPLEALAGFIRALPDACGAVLAAGMWFDKTGRIDSFPFLKQCAPILAQQCPDHWRRWCGGAPNPRLDAMAAGPVLMPEQLIAAVGDGHARRSAGNGKTVAEEIADDTTAA
jgi:hypothetical protein